MSATDFMIEQAEMRVAQEREVRIGAVAALVAGTGCTDCKDCGFDIPPERRSAAPFAERCIECQEIFERGK